MKNGPEEEVVELSVPVILAIGVLGVAAVGIVIYDALHDLNNWLCGRDVR